MKIPEWALMMKLNVHEGRDPRWGVNGKLHSFSHSFKRLVPAEHYFDEHPEYFSLVDGCRRRDESQLCCTNPAVVDVVCATLKQRMVDHPDKTIFSLGQNDLRLYRDLGIKNIFCQNSAVTGGQFEPLRQYVEAKLLWDPDLNVEELMTEWAEGIYGVKTAAPILDYLFMLEDRRERESIHRTSFIMSSVPQLFTPELLEKGRVLWD